MLERDLAVAQTAIGQKHAELEAARELHDKVGRRLVGCAVQKSESCVVS